MRIKCHFEYAETRVPKWFHTNIQWPFELEDGPLQSSNHLFIEQKVPNLVLVPMT